MGLFTKYGIDSELEKQYLSVRIRDESARDWTGFHMINQADIDNWFSYHAPQSDQADKYQEIREEARRLAYLILKLTPSSADQTAAIRKLRECVMTANAAIACGE